MEQLKYKKQGVSSTFHIVVGLIALILFTAAFFIVAEFLIFGFNSTTTLPRDVFRIVCGGLTIMGFMMGVLFIAGQKSWDLQGFIFYRVTSGFIASMIVSLVLNKAQVMGWTVVTPWKTFEPDEKK